MAVPTLASIAALTLLYAPAAQPENISIDYTPLRRFATRIQRAFRNIRSRRSRRAYEEQRQRNDEYMNAMINSGLRPQTYYGPGFTSYMRGSLGRYHTIPYWLM